MSKPTATIAKYMTKAPHSIGRDQTLTHAHELMREHRIRHLPVLDGGRLVGIISQRDLHLIEALSDVKPDAIQVDEAMTQLPFCVPPDAPLENVVREMAAKKYGSAVVMKKGSVVGVFTTIDALRALGTLLHDRS